VGELLGDHTYTDGRGAASPVSPRPGTQSSRRGAGTSAARPSSPAGPLLKIRQTTPLHAAVRVGDLAAVHRLLTASPLEEAECDLQAGDEDGNTPLHLACQRLSGSFATIAILLVQAGARLLARNDDGLTCIDVCLNPALATVLQMHIARLRHHGLTSLEERHLLTWGRYRYGIISTRWLLPAAVQARVVQHMKATRVAAGMTPTRVAEIAAQVRAEHAAMSAATLATNDMA